MFFYLLTSSIVGLIVYKLVRKKNRSMYDVELIQCTPPTSPIKRMRVSPCVSITPEGLSRKRVEWLESPVRPLVYDSDSETSDMEISNCYFEWDGRGKIYDRHGNLDF